MIPQNIQELIAENERLKAKLAMANAMLHEITEQNDRLEERNNMLNASRNDWKRAAENANARIKALEDGTRKHLMTEHRYEVGMDKYQADIYLYRLIERA